MCGFVILKVGEIDRSSLRALTQPFLPKCSSRQLIVLLVPSNPSLGSVDHLDSVRGDRAQNCRKLGVRDQTLAVTCLNLGIAAASPEN